MEGFDAPGVFYSESFEPDSGSGERDASNLAMKRRFGTFLREFSANGNFKYRNELKGNYLRHSYWLEVVQEDLSAFDDSLADRLSKRPTEMIPLFEEAATEVADELTSPRPFGEETIERIQLIFASEAHATALRQLSADVVSRLIKITGIVVSASGIKAKATRVSLQCRSCKHIVPNMQIKPGLDGFQLPIKCLSGDQHGGPPVAARGGMPGTRCPLDPYFIMPTKCQCVDYQIIKIQETPDSVPHGEVPRHLTVFVDRALCDRVVPGNRITVLGVYCIRKISGKSANAKISGAGSIGVRAPYVRAVGVNVTMQGMGRTAQDVKYSIEEEDDFRRLAARSDIHELIAKSIAPDIYGFQDVKKSIACLLFGGSRKILPDGLTRRGDINVLLLGDPGTAKSQLLKFVERIAPIAVYTSGKGSSAAGLTASVMRDPSTRNFVVEGGAMVLADGGVVCIDEFDKMREDDRVAIHEAMEQQTISLAKAGITTTLNTRCSVLAAANSVFGRWDDTKADAENIDFMPTILSRFDCIFIIKDEHNAARDMTLAKHVIGVHVNASSTAQSGTGQANADGDSDVINPQRLKRFICYARNRCGPRLSADAADKLKSQYVRMRQESKGVASEAELAQTRRHTSGIHITVRQLEAIVRMAESLAKMQLKAFVDDTHVEESLRLFRVSTLSAAQTGALSGVQGFTSDKDRDLLQQIERQICRRFAVGSQVATHAIVQDFVRQKYPEGAVHKVILCMIRRGELQHRMQRKMLFRLK